MKYLTTTTGKTYIFDDEKTSHAKEADRHGVPTSEIRGAGFIRLRNGDVECHGESVTLGIGVYENDAKWIKRRLR